MEKSNTSTSLTNDTKSFTRKVTIKNLNEKQKRTLLNSGLGLGGILSGAALFSLLVPNRAEAMSSDLIIDADNEDIFEDAFVGPVDQEDTELTTNDESVDFELDLPMSQSEFTGLSFEDAFKSAREELGAGGAFEWNGDTYNTYYKEEWDTMSEDDQADFLASVNDSTNDNYLTNNDEIFIDVDNDGIAEVILKDIDGDGNLDVKSVDLNDDGNIDVVHVVSNEEAVALNSDEDSMIDLKIKHDGLDAEMILSESEDKVSVKIEAEIDKDSPYMESLDGIQNFMDDTSLNEVVPNDDLGDFEVEALPSDDLEQISLEEIDSSDTEAINEANQAEFEVIVIDEGSDQDFEVVEEDEVIRMDEFEVVTEEEAVTESDSDFDELSDLFEGDGIIGFDQSDI